MSLASGRSGPGPAFDPAVRSGVQSLAVIGFAAGGCGRRCRELGYDGRWSLGDARELHPPNPVAAATIVSATRGCTLPARVGIVGCAGSTVGG